MCPLGCMANIWDACPPLQDDKLAATADSLLSCIAVLDGAEQKFQITYMDKAYEQLTGYSRDELLGRPFLEVGVTSPNLAHCADPIKFSMLHVTAISGIA